MPSRDRIPAESVVGTGQMSGSAQGEPATPARPGLTLLGIGTAAGVYSGLFGVGGGSVMVPLLLLLLAYDPRAATATSLAAITVIATAGAITHAIYGNVAWAVAGVVAVPAIVGAVVGTSLQQRVPREWITIGLALLLIVGALDLLRPLVSEIHVAFSDAVSISIPDDQPVDASSVSDPLVLAIAGLAAGMLGGMVGIGGGILVVPVLLYTQEFGEREAIATSLAAMVPMSLAAAARHHHYGNLRLKEGVSLGVLGIVGAAIGASLAEIAPEDLLRGGFAALMLLIAAQLVRGVRRDRRAPATPDA